MRYLMSDVTGFTIHEENGGCGQPHTIEANADGVRVIECPACESAMSRGHGYGHSLTPETVRPTPDEIAAQERAEQAAQKAGVRIVAGYAAGGGSDQLAAMQATIAQLQQTIAELQSQRAPAEIAAGPAPVPVKAAPAKAATKAAK